MLNWFLCEREISSLNKTFQRQRLNCYTLTDIFATVCLNEHTLTVCCMQRICPKCLPWSWVMHTGSSVSVSMGHSLGHGSVFPLVTHWVIGHYSTWPNAHCLLLCFSGTFSDALIKISRTFERWKTSEGLPNLRIAEKTFRNVLFDNIFREMRQLYLLLRVAESSLYFKEDYATQWYSLDGCLSAKLWIEERVSNRLCC